MGLEKHFLMKEASRILGVSVRRLQIWDKQGKIKCVRIIGGRGEYLKVSWKGFLE